MIVKDTPEIRLALSRALVALDDVGGLADALYLLAMTTEARRGAGSLDKRDRSEYMAEEIDVLLKPLRKAHFELRNVFPAETTFSLARIHSALADKVQETGQDTTHFIERFEP